jgi:hypothetical protein
MMRDKRSEISTFVLIVENKIDTEDGMQSALSSGVSSNMRNAVDSVIMAGSSAPLSALTSSVFFYLYSLKGINQFSFSLVIGRTGRN